MTTTIDLDTFELSKGSHGECFTGEACATELAHLIRVGELHGHLLTIPDDAPLTDSDETISPVLGSFVRAWNDGLDSEPRQRLKPYIPRLVGTVDVAADEVRAWMLTDWLVHDCAPAWLDCAGLTAQAAELRALPAITSAEAARAAQPTLDRVRKQAAAAGDAAWDAARDAARDVVAWAVAWAAAGDAAWDAARDAAARDVVAWDAARDAAARDVVAWAVAWDAARAAAWAVAWAAAARDVAWAAARAAAGAAAPRDAARAKLAPVVALVQESAFSLLDRLIDAKAAA